jgi:hypothetical protein
MDFSRDWRHFVKPAAAPSLVRCTRGPSILSSAPAFSKSIRARPPFVHTSAMDAVVQADLSRCDERTRREYRNHAVSFARGNGGSGGIDRNQTGLSAPANQNL